MDAKQMIKPIYTYIQLAASIIENIYYWAKNIKDLKKVLVLKKDLAKTIKTIVDVNEVISTYRWKKAKRKWIPWVTTLIHKNFRCSCEGAAFFGKWLFTQIGMKSDIYRLSGENTAFHLICITRDKKYMISNHLLINLKTFSTSYMDWEDFIKAWFNYRYNKITKIY